MDKTNNWFHDLFINEAKPALKRHSGSGGSSNPITEPITITENGFYPVPKGGGLEFGKEYKFKEAITEEDFQAYIAASNGGEDVGGMRAYVLCDAVELAVMPVDTNNVYMVSVLTNGAENVISYVLGGSAFGFADGWQLADKTPTNAPTITVAEHAKMSADLATTAIFFDIETKSLDGWGDITVNVQNEILNIAYGDTAPEDTSKLWVKTTEPSAVKVASEINLVPNDNNTMLNISASLKKIYTSFAQVGSKTYVFGGSSNGYTNEIEVFDTSTETVSKLSATMPAVRANHKSVAIGTKIYIIGGNIGGAQAVENTIFCFDTETQICTTLSTKLPYGLGYMGAASYGSKIYIFGGLNASNQRINTILCFDTEADTITALDTTMPMALLSICAITAGSSIYLFSGSNGMSFQKYAWKFDCINQSIEEISVQIPSAWTGQWNGCVVGSQIVLINGNSKAIAVFNLENEVLTTTTLAVATNPSYVAMASAGDVCYLLNGTDGKGYKIVLGLTHILLADILLIHSNLNNGIFNLINTDTAQVEIGVNKVYKGNADGIGEEVEAALHNGTQWVNI